MDGPYKVLHDKSLLYFSVILFICLDWDSFYWEQPLQDMKLQEKEAQKD